MIDEESQDLKLLESLDLGHRNEEVKESKGNDFEDELTKLFTKLDGQIQTLKEITNVNYQVKPFNIESNENSFNKGNEQSNYNNINNQILNNSKSRNYTSDNNPYIINNNPSNNLNDNNQLNIEIIDNNNEQSNNSNFKNSNNININSVNLQNSNNNFQNKKLNNNSNFNILSSNFNDKPQSNNNLENSNNNLENSNNKDNSNNNIIESKFNIINSNNNIDDSNNNIDISNNNLAKPNNNIDNLNNNMTISNNKVVNSSNNFLVSNNNMANSNNFFASNNNEANSNNNNNPTLKNINSNNDDFEIDIDSIPEIDNQPDENNKNSIIQKPIENIDISNNNISQNGNFKLDTNEIEINNNSRISENNNNNLLDKEQEKKAQEEKEREEEERKRKELEKKEEEERIRQEEEERIKKEKEEEERRKKLEEEEKKKNLEDEEESKKEEEKKNEEEDKNIEISVELDIDDENNNNDDNKKKEKLRKKKQNNKDDYQSQKKDPEKQEDLDIEDIESVNSINLDAAPESANVSGIIPSIRNTNKNQEIKNNKIKESENKIEEKKDESGEKLEDIKESKQSKRNNEENDENKLQRNSTINDLRNNSMPQNKKLQTSQIKKELKKSYTQKGDIQIKPTITKIEKSEESHIDISNIEDYPTLTNFVQEEIALNEVIPDFKEKILAKESKDDIKTREFFLSKEKYIKDDIEEGQELSPLAGEIEESHTDLMRKIFEENQLKNLPEFESDFEEKVFDENQLDPMNCPIGGVENVESFIQKYFLSTNVKIIESSKKFFSKWRRILGDGSSFYRILMFSILEAYILSKNINELKYILAEITSDEYIEIYKEKNIDYNTCFIIFSGILNFLENNNISKAYEILLKSYLLKDYSFDKMLIVYIKHVISFYINKINELLNKEGKIIDNNRLNTYMIESPNIEPSFLIICIIPYLFNVNMNLMTLKGEILKPNQNQINLIDPEEEGNPLISFGYFFSSYYKLYSIDFETKYNFNLNLIENNYKQLTYVLKNLKPCEKCVKKTVNILFLEKKFIICKNCLEDHLSYVCNFRADAFKEDGFLGLEYYTRPIHICDNYYIDDLEIIELLESFNILNALCQKFNERICNECKEKKDVENIYDLKCGCTYCGNCIEKIVLQITNGIKVLNAYEKKQLGSHKCHSCNNDFDIKEALKLVKHNQEDEKDAAIRLKTFINTLCLVCNKELREEYDNSGGKKYKDVENGPKFKIIKLKKNIRNERANGIEYMEIEHLICEDCYNKYIKLKINKDDNEDEEEEDEEDEDAQAKIQKNKNKGNNNGPNKKIVDLDNGTIYCGICCRNHDLDPKLLNEGGCCSGCIIY